MNVSLDNHRIRLRFKLDNDAPNEYRKLWNQLKYNCERSQSDEKEEIIQRWLSYCELESNKKLISLDRCEGGISTGQSNIGNKQIRFRKFSKIALYQDNDIVFDQVYNSDNGSEKWSFDELDDLVTAFRKCANYYLSEECVRGWIEFVNNQI